MSGTFLLSLDCEGRWGLADRAANVINPVTSTALDAAYEFIFKTLDHYGIRGTFAFTSLFAVDIEILHSYIPSISALAKTGDTWYQALIRAIGSRHNLDGWVGSKYFAAARSYGHEIAWHGFTHRTLNNNLHDELFEFELKNGLLCASELGVVLKTVIFPRNVIGKLHSLEQAGFTTYRPARDSLEPHQSIRLFRLLSEYSVRSLSQKMCGNQINPLKAGTAGYMLNWPSGPRKLVPEIMTIAKWNHILDHAEEVGGCAHLWLHPHNLVTAPKMSRTFETIIQSVAERIKDGRLKNIVIGEESI